MKTVATEVRVDSLHLALEMSAIVPPSMPAGQLGTNSPNAASDMAERAILARAERIERWIMAADKLSH